MQELKALEVVGSIAHIRSMEGFQVHKKMFLALVFLLLSLLDGWVTLPALAQESRPAAPTIIPGKPVPGSRDLPVPAPGNELGLSRTQSPAASESPDWVNWHRLVYQSYQDGNWEIYLADHDGSGPIRLTNESVSNVRPRLNHSVTRVLFDCPRNDSYEIYTVNLDASQPTRLTDNQIDDYAGAWSTDDSRIVFTSERDGNPEIYVMNADGSSQGRLTVSPYGDTEAAWSLDGSKIAWVRYHDFYGAVWVMNADGSNPHPLTGDIPYLGHPAWSPDGKQIAFDADADWDGWNELALIQADGTGLKIFYDPGTSMQDALMGSWTLNGEIVYFSMLNYIEYQGQLYLDSTMIFYKYITATGAAQVGWSGYDMNPDWGTLDRLPPVSSVRPLPAYSRASGFDAHWYAYDQGPSGLYYAPYRIEYRVGPGGTWTNFCGDNCGTGLTSWTFTDLPGEITYFRSQAQDNAYNWEAWPEGDGDAWTKVFQWLLEGRVLDSRQSPVEGALLNLAPAAWESTLASDASGHYAAHIPDSGIYSLSASRPGYGALSAASLALDQDRSFDAYLPPADNLLSNGGFETSSQTLVGWATSGTFLPSIGPGLSGSNAASLGKITLDGARTLLSTTTSRDILPQIVRDPFGYLHAVWFSYEANGILYSMKEPLKNWTQPVQIPDASGYESVLTVAPDGSIHVAWISSGTGYYDRYIGYAYRVPGGNWIATSNLTGEFYTYSDTRIDPNLVVDALGEVSLVWGQSDGLWYMHQAAGGAWSSATQLAAWQYGHSLALDSTGLLHLIYFNDGQLFYRIRSTDGNWGAPVLCFEGSIGRVYLDVGAQDRLFLFWISSYPYQVHYSEKPQGGAWTNPSTLDSYLGDTNRITLAVGPEDIIHLSWWNSGKFLYRKRFENNLWSPLVTLESAHAIELPALWADDQGVVQIAYSLSDGDLMNVYHDELDLPQTATTTLSQQVLVPANMHMPTLAYQAWVSTTVSSGSLRVNIDQTPAFTSSQNSAGWVQHWTDLSAWAGQSVTLTFSVQNDLSGGLLEARIDDVSIGSWLTPRLTQVSPSHFTSWAGQTITIYGENFIQMPSVQAGSQALTALQWIDEHTLQASLLPDLPAGMYDLCVTNPGGQAGCLPKSLLLGWQTYLPLVAR